MKLQGRVYSLSAAQRVVEQLDRCECDGWTYAIETQKEFARIAVYDENKIFQGYY